MLLPTASPTASPVLIFPGDGIFFWWQAGAVAGLSQRFDLSRARVAGASAGALSASSVCCGLDNHRGLELALALTEETGVWQRGPFGLYGVWGGIIREWLEMMLPDDAHSACSDRAFIAVKAAPRLQRPYFRTQLLSDYASRADLIDATMASLHIPWFMDRRATARFRGHRYIDGSFPLLRDASRHLYLPTQAGHLCLRSSDDARIRRRCDATSSHAAPPFHRCGTARILPPFVHTRYASPADFLGRGVTAESAWQMMAWGEEYVEELELRGGLEVLESLRRS